MHRLKFLGPDHCPSGPNHLLYKSSGPACYRPTLDKTWPGVPLPMQYASKEMSARKVHCMVTWRGCHCMQRL